MELVNSDDNEIFELTGCLSKCDKYEYSARAVNDLQNYPAKDPEDINTITMRFIVPSGEYELREQVILPSSKEEHLVIQIDFSTWSMTGMLLWLMLVVTSGCYLDRALMASMK